MNTPLSETEKQKGYRREHIEVQDLFDGNKEKLHLKILAGGSGMNRHITEKELHRPGLPLAGFLELFSYSRVQLIGNTETKYLNGLGREERTKAIKRVMDFNIPCIIITNNNNVDKVFLEESEKQGIPVLGSEKTTTDLTHHLRDFLDDIFASTISVHGSLVDVYGTGMLFTGQSGIGKSEISLDLVERGHRLVADDSVKLISRSEGVLIGTSPEMIRHMMEVRGVGLIDVRSMFGVRGIRMQKRVEVEVHLEEWDDNVEWERIGLDYETTSYLGVEIPLLRLPIFPGKNISMIAEVIALQIHLRVYGINAADTMSKRMMAKMDSNKIKKYLSRDFE